ncbi:MAG TPA: ATP-binding protein [Phycisphaerae bacterium]|nr:ATP-binding protein [Phycisphaerae bacterium]
MPSSATSHSTQLLSIAKQEGVPDLELGRRAHPRYTLGMRVDISTDPTGGNDVQTVLVHNVSAGGIGVWTQRQFAPGASLSVLDADGLGWIMGVVQHSSPGVHGYMVGIQFVRDDSGDRGSSAASNGSAPGAGRSVDQEPQLAESRSLLCLPLAIARIAKGGLTGLLTAGSVYVGLRILDFEIFPVEVAIGFGISAAVGAVVGLLGIRREQRYLRGIESAIRALSGGESIESLPAAPTSGHAAINREMIKLIEHQQQQNVENSIRRQQNLELQEVKSGILSIVSQDVRQPLQAIQQHAEVLREEIDSLSRESRLDLIEIIAQQSTNIAQQVSDLEELQQLDRAAEANESGNACYSESCCLEDTIRDVVSSFETLARSSGIHMELDCPESLPPALADPEKISRVLRRLVSNAIASTPAGGDVAVTVEERPCELVVSVADSGSGIPRERWGAAFDRVSCTNDQEGEQDSRLGLGLYIARRIVESHNGRIWLDSEMDQGAVVYFAIPTTDTCTEEPVSIEPLAGNCRVVICDSDPELAAMMAQALRYQDYHVSVAHCGERLIELLDREPFDVVLTDVQVTDMSTSELLGALHSRRELNFATILHSFEEGLDAGNKLPVVAYLPRPADRRRLYEAVALAAKRRLVTGKTLFFLDHGSMDTRRLRGALEEAGHVVVTCGSMKELQRLLKCYRCDSYLIPQGAVRGDWGEVIRIQNRDDDGVPTSASVQPVVLVDEVLRSERGIEDQFGIKLVAYRPGFEAEVVEQMESTRANQPQEISAR